VCREEEEEKVKTKNARVCVRESGEDEEER
jgi:hypothetical protein